MIMTFYCWSQSANILNPVQTEKKKIKWFLSQSICNVSRAQVYRIAMGLDEYLTKKAHHVGVARGALLSCRKCGETLIR